MKDLQKIRESLINGMGKLPSEGQRTICVEGETYPCRFIRADIKKCLVYYDNGHGEQVHRAEFVTEWIPF